MQMREEAFLMDAIFATSPDSRVLPPPASSTSAMRVYRLHRGTGVKVDRVISLAAELDEALSRCPAHAHPSAALTVCPEHRGTPPEPEALRLRDLLSTHGCFKALTANGRLLTVAGEGHSLGGPTPCCSIWPAPTPRMSWPQARRVAARPICSASMVLSLAALHSPQRLALVILDPKGVDLVTLAGLPHLATPIITDPVEAVGVLALGGRVGAAQAVGRAD